MDQSVQPVEEPTTNLENGLVVDVLDTKLQCDHCKKLFVSQKTLYKHTRLAHGIKLSTNGTMECPVDWCKSVFSSVTRVRDHLQAAHDLPQPSEMKVFANFEDFLQWKTDIEASTASSYVKTSSSAAINSLPGAFKARYRCHRSGKYRSHGTGKKTLKSQRSCKVGHVCPAAMEVITNPNRTVEVTIWPTHYGHKQDLGHLWLSAKEKNALAVKISQGRTFDEILDEIRRDVDGGISRLHLLKRKDLHNIVQAYNLKSLASAPVAAADQAANAVDAAAAASIAYTTNAQANAPSRVSIGRGQYTENEVVDVNRWVARMQEMGDESPVLLYRSPFDDAGLSTEGFILVVMTGGQRLMLLRFAQERICLDVMQRDSEDEFSVTVLLVLDENGYSLPVAFCFSADADERAVTDFLCAVRDRVGPICCRTFLSNATPLCYDAWLTAMATPAQSLLPLMWHMDRSWRKKIADLVAGGDCVRDRTFAALRALLRGKDDLRERQAVFVEGLVADPSTLAFGQYFGETYAGLMESWGNGVPPAGAKNEYTRLEAYHKILKHIYTSNRLMTNMDACLSAFLRKARDKIFERLTKLATDAVDCRTLGTLRRHQRGSMVAPADLAVVDDGRQWRVIVHPGGATTNESEAAAADSEVYVFKEGDECPLCDQREYCDECRAHLCPHLYVCTCGGLIDGLMCSHVHAVISNFVFMRPAPPATDNPLKMDSPGAEEREAEMRALSVAVADVPSAIASTEAPASDELLQATGSRLNLLTCLMQRDGRSGPYDDTLRQVNALLDRCVDLLMDKPKQVTLKRSLAGMLIPKVEPTDGTKMKRCRRGRKLEEPPQVAVVELPDTSTEVQQLMVSEADASQYNLFQLDGEQIIKICYALPGDANDHDYC